MILQVMFLNWIFIMIKNQNINQDNGININNEKFSNINIYQKIKNFKLNLVNIISVNGFVSKKAEFIPPEYNFKFFKPGNKGVVKKISRNEIPFKVDKDTKILLERKQGIKYDENYLEGPYYEDQNIIEIIDEKKKE